MAFDDIQRLRYVAYTPMAVAPLSILGSTLTLLTLYRTYRQQQQRKRQQHTYTPQQHEPESTRTRINNNNTPTFTTYHRLLMGISVLDIFFSLGLGLSFIMVPRDVEYELPGHVPTWGNHATCQLQAVLLQLGTGSFCYSALLMLYYVLVIRFGWKEAFISQRAEPAMHVLALGYYGSTVVIGWAWQVFNPAGTLCWVAGKPLGCNEIPDYECERGGDRVHQFGHWLLVVPLIATTSFMCLCLLILVWTVWWRWRQSQRFVFEAALADESRAPEDHPDERDVVVKSRDGNGNDDEKESGNDDDDEPSIYLQESSVDATASGETGPPPSQEQPRLPPKTKPFAASDIPLASQHNNNYYYKRKSVANPAMQRRVRLVLSQSFLYAVTFINCTAWMTVSNIASIHDASEQFYSLHFWIDGLHIFFLLIQGFFSFLIFIRPRYLSIRNAHPRLPRWRALCIEAIWYPLSTRQERNQRANKLYQNSNDGSHDNNDNTPNGSSSWGKASRGVSSLYSSSFPASQEQQNQQQRHNSSSLESFGLQQQHQQQQPPAEIDVAHAPTSSNHSGPEASSENNMNRQESYQDEPNDEPAPQ